MDRIDLFHLPFIKRSIYRFRPGNPVLDRQSDGGERKKRRRIIWCKTVWPEPYAWKHTPDEQKISKDFAFSEEGLDEIYEWLLGDGRKLIMES